MTHGASVSKPGVKCASDDACSPCYTTSILSSLLNHIIASLPFSSLLAGRGTETDPGEPLLWQLPSEWWAEGQPDVIYQWPQSSRTWQKPIRWANVTVAHLQP